MLNSPLSLLPDELFLAIVDHVAELPSPNKHLCSLSIADRTFTWFCQAHIFMVLNLGLSSHLEKMRKILDNKPSLANSVREVNLTISHNQNAWLFNNSTFISIFQLLAKSLMPPHKLSLSGSFTAFLPRLIELEEPILTVGQFMQTFFSRTLTVLHLTKCANVPLTLFLICPGLREIMLSLVEAASEESYDEYPDEQCSGRELPTLDSLHYCYSESLVKQMTTPPPRFHTAVVLWSKLRVLTLSPNREDLLCLQPILDAACNTLEELHLTRLSKNNLSSLAGLVNLGSLSCLRICAFRFNGQKSVVPRELSLVLSTIPTSNKVTNLTFDFAGTERLVEDWAGLCDEVVRISGGKYLDLTLDVIVEYIFVRKEEFRGRIMEKIAPLSEYPNIRTRCDVSCR